MLDWLAKFAAMIRGVIALIVARLGVFGSLVAVTAVVLAGDMGELWGRVKKDVFDAICDVTEEKTGLVLDRNDPASDASISAALSARSGIYISTVKDAGALAADLSAHASGLIQVQTGIELTNLLSAEQVKADVVAHAVGVVQEKTGLNIAGVSTFDEVQKRVSAHVSERLAELVADRLHDAAIDFARPEATLDELLTMVYRAQEVKGLRARDVALGVAASLVVAAYARTSAPLRRRVDAFRRRAQNREAQRRFRALHGNRMRYDKLPKAGAPAG